MKVKFFSFLSLNISEQIQYLDILGLYKRAWLRNLEHMTNREQLIQELEQAPDDLVQTVLDFLHRVKAIGRSHPLVKFAGILSDSETEELQRVIATECWQVDMNEW